MAKPSPAPAGTPFLGAGATPLATAPTPLPGATPIGAMPAPVAAPSSVAAATRAEKADALSEARRVTRLLLGNPGEDASGGVIAEVQSLLEQLLGPSSG